MDFFSPSTGGFYHAAMHENIPDDKVAVTPEEKMTLLLAQGAGKRIVVEDGKATIADQPQPSDEQHMANLRVRRDRLLAASDFSQVADVPLSDAKRAAWTAYRKALRDLPATFKDNPGEVVFPAAPV